MGAGIFCGNDFTLNTTLTKSWTDYHALQTFQFLGNILLGDLLAVDEVQLRLYIVIDTCQIQTLTDTLVGILQVVFTYQSDVYLLLGITLLVEEVVPGLHGGCLAYGNTNLT